MYESEPLSVLGVLQRRAMPRVGVKTRKSQWASRDLTKDGERLREAVESLRPFREAFVEAANSQSMRDKLATATADQGKINWDFLPALIKDDDLLTSILLIIRLGVGRFEKVPGQRYTKNEAETMLDCNFTSLHAHALREALGWPTPAPKKRGSRKRDGGASGSAAMRPDFLPSAEDMADAEEDES